jgi:hypothetical protein
VDNEIIRVGFMSPQNTESFVKRLEGAGLEFLRDGEAIDIAVVDQLQGITSKCIWLEFGDSDIGSEGHRVSACRLVGSQLMKVITPLGWEFEGSLSSTYTFIPTEEITKSMKFLRHEKGLDVYLNLVTGKEMYIGRTSTS